MIENSEFEVLTLSSDSEFVSEGGPDSESTLDREPVHVQIIAKCSEEDAPSAAGCQPGVRDIDCPEMSSEMRGPFAVRSKVSPVTSVFSKSCGVRTPEFIQPQARAGDLGSGERSECLESSLRSRIVDIQAGDSPQIVPSGSSVPPPTSDESGRKGIMDLLRGMGGNRSGRSLLKSVDLLSFVHESVKHLLAEFNGDRVFELPPLIVVKEGSLSRLDGMDRKRDGHVWMETATTNISDPSGTLSFKYVKCMGHLRCDNIDCLMENGSVNELYWSGSSPDVIPPGHGPILSKKFKIICKFCKLAPSCIATCQCKMFYVVSKDPLMSRACIHIGTHMHPVAKGDCRDAMDQIRDEIRSQVAKTPTAKASAIGIAVEKELLMKGLIDEVGDGRVLLERELDSIFEKWSALSTSIVDNLIHHAKVSVGGGGYVDNILKLKKGSKYDYIQNSQFLGQGSDLAYLFKMSTIGPRSGVDLVK